MKAKGMFLQKQTALSAVKITLIVLVLGLGVVVYAWSDNTTYEPLPAPSNLEAVTPLTELPDANPLPITDSFVPPPENNTSSQDGLQTTEKPAPSSPDTITDSPSISRQTEEPHDPAPRHSRLISDIREVLSLDLLLQLGL